MVKIFTKLLEGIRTRREETALIREVDILKWEHELTPAAIKLAEELDISFEDALTYLKCMDDKKGAGGFKEKLQNVMAGMKAASETINAAMGVNETPTNDPPIVERKRNKRKPKEKPWEFNWEEPDIYIPEVPMPKMPKMPKL